MNSNNHDNKSQHKDLVFFVRVQYRCNSSWQGTIQWIDGKQQTTFRSALELGSLIKSAKDLSCNNDTLKQWKDKESVS